MRQVLKAFIVLVVTTLAPPSFATGVDGVWECKAFGTLVATIGFEGRNYVLANKSGQSGRGKLAKSTRPSTCSWSAAAPYTMTLELSAAGGTLALISQR